MLSEPRGVEDAAIDGNVADFAVHLVVRLGAQTAFGLTGGMAMYLNHAAAAHPTLRTVYCQHEQACAAAAEGYAKACGFQQPGLAIVTAGPGVTNTITSLCSAYGDSAPVIVLAGQVKTADIDRLGCRTHGAQEVHSRDIVGSCVKHFVRLSEANWLDELTAALAEAFTGRPGPVFIEIPLDVQNRVVRFTSEDIEAAAKAVSSGIAQDPTRTAIAELADALDWLMSGERPLIYLGNGCRVAAAESAARRFIEGCGVPFVTSWLAADQLSACHPLNFGAPGGLAPISANKILFAADRILFLGARLDLLTTAFQPADFGGQAERVIVDVDPVELGKFVGFDRTRTICANLAVLGAAIDLRPSEAKAPDAWVEVCQRLRKEALGEEATRLKTLALNVYEVALRLSRWSAGKAFVTTGSGLAIEAFIRFFAPEPGARLHFGASLGAMGLGLPHALGAAFGAKRQVACVEGDGGLMLNLQELATLSYYAPPGFVLFILNNDGYQSILASQRRHFGEIGGADLASGVFVPSYEKVALAFGLDYRRIETQDELDHLLSGLARDAAPVVVDLIVEPTEPRGPTVRTMIDADGKLRSTSLEEISW
jgi:acetolactate synthase-1/2/3 large subunit